MGLKSTAMINILIFCGLNVCPYTSESDVYRRQILTYKGFVFYIILYTIRVLCISDVMLVVTHVPHYYQIGKLLESE